VVHAIFSFSLKELLNCTKIVAQIFYLSTGNFERPEIHPGAGRNRLQRSLRWPNPGRHAVFWPEIHLPRTAALNKKSSGNRWIFCEKL
jgi:hypothetical protein